MFLFLKIWLEVQPLQQNRGGGGRGGGAVDYVNSLKLGSLEFWRITSSVPNKGKSTIPPLFNGSEMLFSASDKAKLFAKNFSKNSNLDDSGTCFSL